MTPSARPAVRADRRRFARHRAGGVEHRARRRWYASCTPRPTRCSFERGRCCGARRRQPARRASLRARYESVLAAPRASSRSTGPSSTTTACAATVVAPDRTGLLATVAGTLALRRVRHRRAPSVHTHPSRHGARDLHRHRPLRPPRDATTSARRRPARITAALAGELALDEQLRERTARYRRAPSHPRERDVRVAGRHRRRPAHATVIEVHAPDDVGLLARGRAGVRRPRARRGPGDRVHRRRPGRRRVLPSRRERARSSPRASRSSRSGPRCSPASPPRSRLG